MPAPERGSGRTSRSSTPVTASGPPAARSGSASPSCSAVRWPRAPAGWRERNDSPTRSGRDARRVATCSSRPASGHWRRATQTRRARCRRRSSTSPAGAPTPISSSFGMVCVGQALIAHGDVAGGLRHLDEAMVAVSTGEVAPIPAGIIYCAVIEMCVFAFDIRRAAEWTGALHAWCTSEPDLVPYRGQCLVHRSQVLLAHGDWIGATAEAQLAAERLTEPPHPALGHSSLPAGRVAPAPRGVRRSGRRVPRGRDARARSEPGNRLAAPRPSPRRRRSHRHPAHARRGRRSPGPPGGARGGGRDPPRRR